MGQYVLLFMNGTEPEGDAAMADYLKAWADWFAGLGDRVVDQGGPFTGRIKSVAVDGSLKDGPVGERATGYAIIEADTPDAAWEAARRCPHLLAKGQITVYEVYAEA